MSSDIFFLNYHNQGERERLRRTEVFAVARELRAVSGNKLFLNQTTITDHVEMATLVTSTGVPAVSVKVFHPNSRRERSYKVDTIFCSGMTYGETEICHSKQKNYVLRRLTKVPKLERDFRFAVDQGQRVWFQNIIHRIAYNYMSQLMAHHEIENRFTPNFHNTTQEWLLRVVGGYSHRADLPANVENEVSQMLIKYDKRRKFLDEARSLVSIMFDRPEKWLAIMVNGQYIVTAFDPRALVQYLGDALISGSLGIFQPDWNRVPFTYAASPFVRLEDMPDAARESLMGALHLQRVSRQHLHSDVTGIDPDALFPKTNTYLMSNEAGWIAVGSGKSVCCLLMDKD